MSRKYRIRLLTTVIGLLFTAVILLSQSTSWPVQKEESYQADTKTSETLKELAQLAVKGRAPKTNYARAQFGDGWTEIAGCDVRNIILVRDLKNEIVSSNCKVLSGTLSDPYTGKMINFQRGTETSDDIQIDHVVALSNAWQTGAQQHSFSQRKAFANDPLNLLAVEGNANQQKSNGDAATWLPPYKPFRCQYVGRQIKVKVKYKLWVTPAEKQAITRVLSAC